MKSYERKVCILLIFIDLFSPQMVCFFSKDWVCLKISLRLRWYSTHKCQDTPQIDFGIFKCKTRYLIHRHQLIPPAKTGGFLFLRPRKSTATQAINGQWHQTGDNTTNH